MKYDFDGMRMGMYYDIVNGKRHWKWSEVRENRERVFLLSAFAFLLSTTEVKS